jgi:hypothetical protein
MPSSFHHKTEDLKETRQGCQSHHIHMAIKIKHKRWYCEKFILKIILSKHLLQSILKVLQDIIFMLK